MAQPFLGQMLMFGGNFPPKGTAFCNGQLLQIAQNQALFSLLGTFYGGNGTATFALPNLQGSVPVHMGQGPGLSPYQLGESGGTQNVTVNANQMPAHSHVFNASTASATSPSPTGRVPAKPTAVNAAAWKRARSRRVVRMVCQLQSEAEVSERNAAYRDAPADVPNSDEDLN